MTRPFLFLLMLLSLSSVAQKKQPDTIRKYISSDLAFTNKANMQFPALAFHQGDHWVLVSAYPDTTTLLRIWYRDQELTVKDGPFALYHPGRIKAVEGTFVDNVRQGVWKTWHPNGQLKDSGTLVNNYLAGRWYSWNDAGKLAAIYHYTDPDSIKGVITGTAGSRERRRAILAGDTTVGVLNGPTMTFYPNGNLKDSGRYTNDVKQGLWKEWKETGVLEMAGTYEKGNQQGTWEYFHDNGQRSTRETYVNNKVTKLECYDEQGNFTGSACPLVKPALALGPFLDFEKYVLDNLFWPEELKRSDVQGDVVILYTITKKGEMKDLKVVSSPHQAMSHEVMQFFKSLKWSPAVSHNRPIEVTLKSTIPFYR